MNRLIASARNSQRGPKTNTAANIASQYSPTTRASRAGSAGAISAIRKPAKARNPATASHGANRCGSGNSGLTPSSARISAAGPTQGFTQCHRLPNSPCNTAKPTHQTVQMNSVIGLASGSRGPVSPIWISQTSSRKDRQLVITRSPPRRSRTSRSAPNRPSDSRSGRKISRNTVSATLAAPAAV